MDREEGFPPHVVGFMRRKREKEKLERAKLFDAAACADDRGRPVALITPSMH